LFEKPSSWLFARYADNSSTPRIVTGRKRLAADDSGPLPVIIKGEDAGRQVRGRAKL
jgi:hypothetical protein